MVWCLNYRSMSRSSRDVTITNMLSVVCGIFQCDRYFVSSVDQFLLNLEVQLLPNNCLKHKNDLPTSHCIVHPLNFSLKSLMYILIDDFNTGTNTSDQPGRYEARRAVCDIQLLRRPRYVLGDPHDLIIDVIQSRHTKHDESLQ